MKEKDVKKDESVQNQSVNSEAADAAETITAEQRTNDSHHEELEKERAQVLEYKDKYLRHVAEFDNFRKRTAKEKLELIQTAGKEVISSLLDVLDDSERAQKQLASTDDIQQVREGVSLVFGKFKNTLLSKGLKVMESIGQEFNPDIHEAITEIPAPSEDMKGKVLDEVQKGYYLNDKIIRHAKVVVGK
ncbi:MAG: nucleotide exchange factor GrpE [Gemmatimonadaceae bacterium]|nr:nucleotide exchange factor GrpE [Chitinophagaceae bacterium]